jgi:hypothetical protein
LPRPDPEWVRGTGSGDRAALFGFVHLTFTSLPHRIPVGARDFGDNLKRRQAPRNGSGMSRPCTSWPRGSKLTNDSGGVRGVRSTNTG